MRRYLILTTLFCSLQASSENMPVLKNSSALSSVERIEDSSSVNPLNATLLFSHASDSLDSHLFTAKPLSTPVLQTGTLHAPAANNNSAGQMAGSFGNEAQPKDTQTKTNTINVVG